MSRRLLLLLSIALLAVAAALAPAMCSESSAAGVSCNTVFGYSAPLR